MNRQINYIIHAFLLIMLFAAGYFVINNIALVELDKKSESIDVYTPKPGNSDPVFLKGKHLFLNKCASCHHIFKDMTGPALDNFEDRGPWNDRSKLYEWIRNPEAFMKKDAYSRQLKERFGTIMAAFPNLGNDEIDAIVEYINADIVNGKSLL